MRQQRQNIPLASVTNPAGRLDVALYRLCERLGAKLEREQGICGFREYLLPLVEKVIAQNLPAENVIPRELQQIVEFIELNRRRSVAS